MDALEYIEADHRKISHFLNVARDQRDASDLIDAIDAHDEVEERLLYPLAREVLPHSEELLDRSIEAHAEIVDLASQLEDREPDDEQFDALLDDLDRALSEHFADEENELLPGLRTVCTEERLQQMTRELAAIEAEETGLAQTVRGVDPVDEEIRETEELGEAGSEEQVP